MSKAPFSALSLTQTELPALLWHHIPQVLPTVACLMWLLQLEQRLMDGRKQASLLCTLKAADSYQYISNLYLDYRLFKSGRNKAWAIVLSEVLLLSAQNHSLAVQSQPVSFCAGSMLTYLRSVPDSFLHITAAPANAFGGFSLAIDLL